MTRDDIIRMAREVGMDAANLSFDIEILADRDTLTEFAKLVAAAEREACAKVCDAIDKSHWGCEVKASWCSDAIRAIG